METHTNMDKIKMQDTYTKMDTLTQSIIDFLYKSFESMNYYWKVICIYVLVDKDGYRYGNGYRYIESRDLQLRAVAQLVKLSDADQKIICSILTFHRGS